MHSLLARQIKRHLGASASVPEAWHAFLKAVGEAYEQADADRRLMDHSLEQMSAELTDRNRELRRQLREKQATESALLASEARLAKAQQVARLGHWEWDVEHDTLIWSEEVFRIFQADPEAGAPDYQAFLARVHPEDREKVERAMLAALAGKENYSIDHRVLLPDGAVRHVSEQGEVECGADGRPVRMFGTVHDITRRKWVEEALHREKAEQAELILRLEEAHNQLLQSEKMASIGQLAAGVAHEINNPIGFVNSNLGTLRGYVEQLLAVLEAYAAMEGSLPTDSAQWQQLMAAKRAAELDYLKGDILDLLAESSDGIARVRHIVQDLKDFSHTDEGEWVLADLHQGLESTLNVVNNEIKYKAKVIKQYGQLPMVRCLPSQLNQVFMNLLVNATHAIDGQGTITLRTGMAGDEAWVEIADTGSGIPEAIRTRIFDPFYTTKPVGKGTGLGLSISYGIVHKHGGRIELESELGKGSTFRVVLPLHPEPDEASLHG